MADNVSITTSTGGTATVAADDVSSVYYQRVKPQLGADGSVTDALGGAGAVSAGVQRMTLASDDPAVTSLAVIDDWDESDRAKVNPIVGQAGVAAGAGAVGATVQRVTLASDDGAITSLAVMDDWDESDRAKVNPIVGQAGVAAGAGTVSASTQRVCLATDANAVDTELPAAAALADSTVNPTAPAVGAFPHVWDPELSRWHRQRGCYREELLASAARTASVSGTITTNHTARGCIIAIDVTAVAGTPGQIDSLALQNGDWTNWVTIHSFTGLAITTTGTRLFLVYPAAADTGGYTGKANGVLSHNFRVVVSHGNSNSITYSVGIIYLP